MVVRCPNCSGALVYNPTKNKMVCEYCDSVFDSVEEKVPETDEMEYDLYCCTNCGAQLMINDVESATYCAYCQQPTVVFDRVAKQKRPKYIIPFSINKAEAEKLVREKVNKGFFIPTEVKNFKIEQLRGIYIPYKLVDMYYEDSQVWKGTVKSGKSSVTRYFYRKAEHSFFKLSLDASKRLNDNSSVRLEPYYMENLIPFNTMYLSGYYADCSDVLEDETQTVAFNRAKILFDEAVKNTVNASSLSLVESNPKYQFSNIDYALLPAWFMVSYIDGKPHTIMVNGQTGKVVGAMPLAKNKIFAVGIPLSAILGFVCGFISSILCAAGANDDGDGFQILFVIIVFGVFSLLAGIGKFARIKRSQELTTKQEIMNFTTKRTDMGNTDNYQ